jgi:hypothetical protein
MSDVEDWLQDPLRKIENGSYKRRKLKNPQDDKQNDLWWSFHFATRLKLDGADHFCRQALGAASMPDEQGLPLLAHRQVEWYLGAFFFELVSAYDTLLQELNIVYAYDSALKPEDVRWDSIKQKLPKKLAKHMEEEWEKDWFYEVRSHRNLAAHHYVTPLGSSRATVGDEPLNYREHTVHIYCIDKTGNIKSKDINVCIHYLTQMVRYINRVWEEMAQEFQ